MEQKPSKLELLDKYKEDDSEIEELSRIEESELLRSPRFKRFQNSRSSSPQSPLSSSPIKFSKENKKNASYDSIPHLKYKGSNPFLKTPSKKRVPLKPTNRQAPLKFTSSSPSKIQNCFANSLVSLTPAQRVEKKPGKLLATSDILEAYDFKETIGRGAFANVYRAINRVTGDEVAVKEIFIEDDDNILELMQEIDLLKILKHKNIVKYHGFIRNEKKMLIFLEYCSGGSLRHLYKKTGPLTEAKVVEFMKQVINGLIYLHEQGVVHRDVKAANILLTRDGRIKLTDFGVSTQVSNNTIKTFSIAGTPNWMAPEIISMDGTSTASDIWSLGATVVELLTGEPPYSHLNEMAALHAIVTDDNPPIPDFISPLCKDFIKKCFEKQPKLRLSASELLNHPWLNDDKEEEVEVISSRKLLNSFKMDDSIERDFNSIKRFNTKKFLSLECGTFKNSQSDQMTETKISSGLRDLAVDDISTIKHTKMFDPISFPSGDQFEVLKDRLIKEPSDLTNVSRFYSFLENNQHQLYKCVNEPMVFDLLLWIESYSSVPELLFQYLKLLSLFIVIDKLSFVDFGGIPGLTRLLLDNQPSSVRNIAAEILTSLFQDELVLKIFIQCGGLKSSLVLLQEDYKEEKDLLVFITSLIMEAFKSNKIAKTSILLILSSHRNFLDWLAVALLQFINFKDFKAADQVILIIAELKASDRFQIKPIFLNSVFKAYDKLSLNSQVVVVDFLKNIDITSFKESLQLLKFMVKVMKKSIDFKHKGQKNTMNNKLLNMSSSVIFSICHLDQNKKIELIKMDVIPAFKAIMKNNLSSSEFIIPLLCEFSFDSKIIPIIFEEDLLSDYLNLLRSPVWQANAIDSLSHLNEKAPNDKLSSMLQDDPSDSFTEAMLTENGLNYELFLEKLIKFLKGFTKSIAVNKIRLSLFQNTAVVDRIFQKIRREHNSDILIQVNLFKLLKILVLNNYDHPNFQKIINFTKSFINSKILLIDKLVQEILELENARKNSLMLPPLSTPLYTMKSP